MPDQISDLVLGIIGSGGDGVMAAGSFLVKGAAKAGKYAFMHKSFGAQIRGGESSALLRISDKKVISQGSHVHYLVLFDMAIYEKFVDEFDLTDETRIVCDVDDETPLDSVPLKKELLDKAIRLPMRKLAKEAGGPLYKNITSLGMLSEIFGIPEEGILIALRKRFAKKGYEVVQANEAAFALGKKYIQENGPHDGQKLSETNTGKKIVMDGNMACALGAVAAGCRFYAGYPITPSTEVMHYLSKELPRVKGAMIQCEDEIASVTTMCGASFGGAKVLTATSGPGISLMAEGIGLAAITELPIVIINVQRGGPSTGIPTKTEQGDVWLSVYGAHGDAPRFVVAATDVEDCIWAMHEAFYFSEKYQMPAIVMSDGYIGQRSEAFEKIDLKKFRVTYRSVTDKKTWQEYERYMDTETGVSPISVPCKNTATYIAESLEHNEKGRPNPEYYWHKFMSDKRDKKLKFMLDEFEKPPVYGNENAKIGVVTWGSTTGAVVDSMDLLDVDVKVMGVKYLYPLQKEEIQMFVDSVDKVFFVEMSYSAQFTNYIKTMVKLPDKTSILARAGCMPFSPREVSSFIREHL